MIDLANCCKNALRIVDACAFIGHDISIRC